MTHVWEGLLLPESQFLVDRFSRNVRYFSTYDINKRSSTSISGNKRLLAAARRHDFNIATNLTDNLRRMRKFSAHSLPSRDSFRRIPKSFRGLPEKEKVYLLEGLGLKCGGDASL